MTDFYPVLVRAVSKLNTDRPQARQELYDHARKVLLAHLAGKESRASAPEIKREQIALEGAIRRVEAQSQAGQVREMDRLTNSAKFPCSDTTCELSIVDRESPDIYFDGMEDQFEISSWPRPKSQVELSAKDTMPAAPATVIKHIPQTPYRGSTKLKNGSHEKNAPRGVKNDVSNGMGLLGRDLKSQPAAAIKRQTNSRSISVSGEIFEGRRSAFFDPTIMGLAAIVAMLTFIVVICVPLGTIYLPRLVWFSEHIIDDHPTLSVAILISSCSTLVLVLLMIGSRRKTSALRSLWPLLPSNRRSEM